MAAITPQKSAVAASNDAQNVNASKSGGKGRFKETITTVSTTLPIIGAVGTAAVWLAANFYTGDVEILTDRPFNSLEVRVSDKKGHESVFHSPSFQLMPGQYHLEVTVDAQHKQHFDVKAAFHKHQKLNVHVPENGAPVAVSGGGQSYSAPGVVGAFTAPAAVPPAQMARTIAPHAQSSAPGTIGALVTAEQENPAAALENTETSASNTAGKKHWWQLWKKGQAQH
jgi:hypothetical protein